MKKVILSLMSVCMLSAAMAQNDTLTTPGNSDTIRIGGMIILKKGSSDEKNHVSVTIRHRYHEKISNVSTQSFVFDLGFANWVDKTDYPSATAGNYLVNRPGTGDLSATDFRLRTIKSVNVNIWFFMQRLNLIKHYVNLKYGAGLELNNYRFKQDITLRESGANPYSPMQQINHYFIFRDSTDYRKDKLAADYITIPLMLNFRTNPNYNDKGISISAGVSVGYLYSSRNKQISSAFGKHKHHGDYDLQQWKFAYVAELGLGPVHLYGSYSPNSIFQNGIKLMPYNVGVRFSNW